MQRRLFIQGGSAALAAMLSGCGGGGGGAGNAALNESVAAPLGGAPASAPAPALAPSAIYTFQQEFDDASLPLLRANGGPFNPYWTYFGGNSQPEGVDGIRWWNDEMQVYTTSGYTPAPFNPLSVRNGVLSISGKPSNYGSSPKPYLSGCIETSNGIWWDSASVRAGRGGFEQKYGYWEARVRIPKGKGLWPAFWLSGGIQAGVGGEKMGEIDIFETVGDGKIYQTVHDWWATSDANDSYGYQPSFDYSADFHTYGLLWTANEIVWYVDGVETRRASAAMVARYRDLCGPMYLAFNLAIGGGWPGSPDGTTPFPATMDIDYIRVRAV